MKISIYELVGSSLTAFVCFTLLLILCNVKNFYNSKRFWLSLAILSAYLYISFLLTDNGIKAIIQFFLNLILCYYVQNNRTPMLKIIITGFIEWIVMLLIDVALSLIIINIFNIDISMLKENEMLKFTSNAILYLILLLIFSFKNILKFVNIVSSSYQKSKNRYILIVIFLSFCLFTMSVYFCLFHYNITFLLIILFIMITTYSVIIIATIKIMEQRSKIQVEYDILLTNLSEYENLLDKQRISNHENKNQLLVIKGMVDKNESNVSEYINSIIDTQYKDNDTLIMKTNRIPSGGLKGLIYYKMLTMKERKINVNLEVDRSLRDLDFSIIPVKTHQELCKIVGVLLDNAIQALENSTNKEINIFLEYVDNEFIIKISNTYDGNIDLDKIDSAGYTTKGKGHGYGLSLVKNIIRDNKVFKNERELNGKLFSQIIKLNIQ